MAVVVGTAANELLVGTLLSDYISGDLGDDTIDAQDGDDTVYGGDGDDQIADGTGADRVYGQYGDDIFNVGGALATADAPDLVDGGGGFDLVVYTPRSTATGERVAHSTTRVDFLDSSVNSGIAAGDTLTSIEAYLGGVSTDLVAGSNGANWFLASLGNDIYNGRDGLDTYSAFVPTNFAESNLHTYTIEIAFGTRAQFLAAQAGLGTISATNGIAFYEIWFDQNNNQTKDSGEVSTSADLLISIERFVGTSGDDKLAGSAANEIFVPREGVNIVQGGGGFDYLSYENLSLLNPYGVGEGVNVDLGAQRATLFAVDSTIIGIEGVLGSIFSDQVAGDAVANRIAGGEGNDALDGRDGKDELDGGDGNDIIVGGEGDDLLTGGAGRDVLDGGAGVDTVSYVDSQIGVGASLLRGTGGTPVGVPGISDASGDRYLRIENIVGSAFADVISGDDGSNVLEGRVGNDTLVGCGGADTIYGEADPTSRVADHDHHPDLEIAPAPGELIDVFADCDCVDGEDESHSDDTPNFDDFICGGIGDDRIFGQLGDDQLFGNEDDDFIEAGVGDDLAKGGAGADKLFGEDGDDELWGGNDNDVVNGGAGIDLVRGDIGNDILDGGLGSDVIYGGTGDDRISGGAGFDFIFGGDGSDTVTYAGSTDGVTVDLGKFWRNSGGDASGDLIEQLLGGLVEVEDAATTLASAVFLSLIVSLGSDDSNQAFTLSVPDVILGVENVVGSDFADEITGDGRANNLDGGLGMDVLLAGGGADILDGGGGADRMVGASGNDVYFVDNAADLVVEDASGGSDLVRSSVTHTLAANIEDLILIGTGAISGFGNGSANLITGNAAANGLFGGGGDDILNGGAGGDKMSGGAGDDSYIVDSVLDEIAETAGGGFDTARSFVTYTLGAEVERLELQGNAAISANGNGLDNILVGNAGANTLRGGAGNDTLIGGAGNDVLQGSGGADRFDFDTALNAATNVDDIVDFTPADDSIYLNRSVFTAIAAGPVSASSFVVGTGPADADDHILYNSTTGKIFYDPDGAGAAAAVLFATVDPGTALTSADFVAYG